MGKGMILDFSVGGEAMSKEELFRYLEELQAASFTFVAAKGAGKNPKEIFEIFLNIVTSLASKEMNESRRVQYHREAASYGSKMKDMCELAIAWGVASEMAKKENQPDWKKAQMHHDMGAANMKDIARLTERIQYSTYDKMY